MHIIDWILMAIPLLIVVTIGAYAYRYMRGVADFMAGGRLANRYLLAVASGELGMGAVMFVASFERLAKAGFTFSWWYALPVPVLLIVSFLGFVTYRFRETRAMTLAQFFEIRYSKRFRIFSGILAFIAGIANFGIIPAVGARCMVYFLGLPENLHLFGHEIPSYIPLMAGLLAITVGITLAGGFVTVMVTDCVEGILSQIIYLVIIGVLLYMFPWSDISATLADAPAGHSRLNPFDSLALEDFNLWYVLMGLAVGVYSRMAWQNASGYRTAARTPHEGRMGEILGQWREMGKSSVVVLLAVCAVTFLQHPDYAAQAATAHHIIDGISTPQIQKQMEVPVALSQMLPIGVKGLLCAVLLMGIFGGDSTHLHSWGGIFVQDILLAGRKKPFTPERHIVMLRFGVIGVALFAFLFGCFFRQTEYIYMWWAVTMAIFTGGAGSAIIGGLYWKKGTTAAAWSAVLVGSTLAVTGIILRNLSDGAFPLNGIQISFATMLISIVVYVVVSLLTCREEFDLDRMLHRGRYAEIDPLVGEVPPKPRTRFSWRKLAGIDTEFSRSDRWIAGGLFAWSVFWVMVTCVGTAWNFIAPWPLHWWSTYWHVQGILIPVTITLITSVWFTWGGLRDIRSFFRRLAGDREINPLDDGFVIKHQNLDEEALAESGVIDAPPPKHSNR